MVVVSNTFLSDYAGQKYFFLTMLVRDTFFLTVVVWSEIHSSDCGGGGQGAEGKDVR